jgi:hypothetical protein
VQGRYDRATEAYEAGIAPHVRSGTPWNGQWLPLAKRMRTSRSQLERILGPDNDKIQLDTVLKAARVLGRELKLELV